MVIRNFENLNELSLTMYCKEMLFHELRSRTLAFFKQLKVPIVSYTHEKCTNALVAIIH